jgi:hypothetical protein
MRHQRLFAIFGLMATLCLGLAWAGGAVQGQDSPPVVGISIPAGDSMALANAIFQANGASSDDSFYKETIYLAGGTYAFSFPGNAQQPQLPPIHANITLHGNGAVIELYGQAETAAVMPLRVQPRAVLNLHHTTVRAMRGTGRAVFNAGVLTLTDSRLTTGAQASGGGIQNDGTLTLLRSSIEGARAATGSNPGGAVLNIGSLTATCSKFINNEASQGGAIYNAQGGQLGAEFNLFLGNKANGGGAIFNALANPTLILPNNFFGAGGAPAVDEYYAGTDTISQRLSVTPFAGSDPTASAACAATPPLPAPASGLSNAGLSALRAPELNVFEQPDLIPQALSYRDNNNVLSVLLPNGQSVAEPSLNSAEVFDTPRWLPDGSKVAYASNQSGNMEIFVLDLASGQTINLSNDADSEDSYPVWSADGSRVMFGVQREGIRIVSVLGRFSGQAAIGAGESGSNIITDPGQPTDVFIARPYIWGTFRPIWSADQSLIYYGVDGSVYSVDMNNRQAESLVLYPGWSILPDDRITRFAGSVISPSPTGTDILFGAQLHAVDNTFIGRPIFIVRGDGSGQRLLLTNFVEGQVHRGVTWFPNGQHALYAEGEGNNGPYRVFKVAVYAGGAPVFVYSSATWSRPAWRPSLQGQTITCTFQSAVFGVNIRSTASASGSLVEGNFTGIITFAGQYTNTSNEVWYRVSQTTLGGISQSLVGWVVASVVNKAECTTLPIVDENGNPVVYIIVTATPTLGAATSTLTPSGTMGTPTPTPNVIYITATPTATPVTCQATVTSIPVRFRLSPDDNDNSWLFFVGENQIVQNAKLPSAHSEPFPSNGQTITIQATLWYVEQLGTTWIKVVIYWTALGQPETLRGFMAVKSSVDGVVLDVPCLTFLPGFPTPTLPAPPSPTFVPSIEIGYVTCHNLTGALNAYNKPIGESKTLIGQVSKGSKIIFVDPNASPILDLNRYERVNIYWPAGSSKGNNTSTAYITIRDRLEPQDGDYITPARDLTCPIASPTPTPTSYVPSPTPGDGYINLEDWGRINYDAQSSLGTGIFPAIVGNKGIHNIGTVDLSPKELEKCLDKVEGCRDVFPVFSPVWGCAYYPPSYRNTVIILVSENRIVNPKCNVEDANRGRNRIFLLLNHLDPATIVRREAFAIPFTNVVQPGELIGNICPPDNACDSSMTDLQHLAIQLYYGTDSGRSGAEIQHIHKLLVPCLYDKYQNALPPSADYDLQFYRSRLQSCALDYDQTVR